MSTFCSSFCSSSLSTGDSMTSSSSSLGSRFRGAGLFDALTRALLSCLVAYVYDVTMWGPPELRTLSFSDVPGSSTLSKSLMSSSFVMGDILICSHMCFRCYSADCRRFYALYASSLLLQLTLSSSEESSLSLPWRSSTSFHAG